MDGFPLRQLAGDAVVRYIIHRSDGRCYAGNGRWLPEDQALEYDSKGDAEYTAAHFMAQERETNPPNRPVRKHRVRAKKE